MSQTTENFHTVDSAEHFKQLLSADLERISLLNFWASWAEPCAKMNEVVVELAKANPKLLTLQVCAGNSRQKIGSTDYDGDRLKPTKSRMKISLIPSRSSLCRRF
jgi:thiol-disulfide isomerase/thioredoxin